MADETTYLQKSLENEQERRYYYAGRVLCIKQPKTLTESDYENYIEDACGTVFAITPTWLRMETVYKEGKTNG